MGDATPGQAQQAQRRAALLLVSLALTAFPFLLVEYVPATDLPQHVAQLRLLDELLGFAPTTVEVERLALRWFGANTLVYAPMFLLSRLCSPRLAGKLGLLLIALSSVGALHALARARGRDPLHAVVAGLLLFSLSLYWGFLNFLAGLPIALWLVARIARWPSERPTFARVCADALLLVALYLAHVLWLPVVALVAFSALACATEHPLWERARASAIRAMCCTPVALLVAAWLPGLIEERRSSGFVIASQYLTTAADRLSLGWLSGTLFGGVRGALEPVATLLLLGYVGVSLLHARQAGRFGVDRLLLSCGAGLALFALLAPDMHLNTMLFNARFLSVGMMLLVIALPDVSLRIVRGATLLAVATFMLVTAVVWSLYDVDDLTGFRESLATIPPGASVLGLDYREESPYLKGRPFLQMFAYAQAEQGGEVAFSFAEHASSIVSYRTPRRLRWTPGLEWLPGQVQLRDLAQFRCTLVNATDAQHAAFRQRFALAASAQAGYFRAYCRP